MDDQRGKHQDTADREHHTELYQNRKVRDTASDETLDDESFGTGLEPGGNDVGEKLHGTIAAEESMIVIRKKDREQVSVPAGRVRQIYKVAGKL